MKKFFLLFPVLAIVALVSGCGQILEKNQTVAENKEWLDFNVTGYDYNGMHVVWTYDYVQGVLGISTPHPLRLTRQVVYLKDGKILYVENLDDNRAKWVEKLKSHGINWHQDVFEAIEQRRVIIGMTIDQVMFSLGHPQLSPPANYRVTRHRDEIKNDDELYYPMYRFAEGDCLLVVVKDGMVVAIDGERPGVFQSNDKRRRRN
ncbi:MAG: hypothetical protein Q8L24_00150 [bacterium]|nr:hypothetical protein [bacterium]